MPDMDVPFRRFEDYKTVDLDKLRPGDSRATLMKKRTHSTDRLIEEYGEIPDDLLIQRECPTCGSSRHSLEFEKDHFDIVRCGECDLVYVNPIMDEEHYRQTYAGEAYQEIVKELGEESHEYRLGRFGSERVEIMKQFFPGGEDEPPRYLDIGCSTGFVVEAAREEGWEAIGIDLNPSAVEFGRERGLELYHSSIEQFEYEWKFDIISLFDVLEHLVHPRRILEEAIRNLTGGGLIFLYLPNYQSASRMLMGKEAHFIWPTHHLNYYTIDTAADLLDRLGLDLAWWQTEGLDIADLIWYHQEETGKDTELLERFADEFQFFVNASYHGKNLRVIARKRD